MIVTLTINPAVDQTLWLDRLAVGHVNRPTRTQLDPAGKGVNASRIAHRLGQPTIALGFVAGDIGHILRQALDAEGVQNHFLSVPGQTRINVTIVDSTATSLYGPGPQVPAAALAHLDEMLSCWLGAAKVLVLAGSLLPGVPDDLYARYVGLARQRGVRSIIDTSGAALQHAVTARPDLIKPNLVEAAALLGRPLPDERAELAGARELHARGIGTVIVSRGARGALCVSDQGEWTALPPVVECRSTVGSGDSMIGAIAAAFSRGDDIVTGLRLGSAAGAATAMAFGTSLGTREDIARLLPEVRLVAI